ncbi:hypothetical protein EMIT0210MI2_10435 [Priestia megaterium]
MRTQIPVNQTNESRRTIRNEKNVEFTFTNKKLDLTRSSFFSEKQLSSAIFHVILRKI